MKGTTYNGSHFANKGTSRSSGEDMFSVGRVVAFRYDHYCSPDGESHSSGCCPSTGNYLLQEEILLEEYNNTSSDRYGSGNYDVKKIVELPDVFWHDYSTSSQWKTFLLGVLDTSENVFLGGFIPGDIAEVRNHPGKFLHIYEIPRGYRKCSKETFADTVSAINLQRMQEDEGAEIITRANAGELVDAAKLTEAHISANQWVITDHEYLTLAKKAGLEIALAVAEANGHQEKNFNLQSWKDAGVTNDDLRSLTCEKSQYYNHFYYIKRSDWSEGLCIAGESYGREAIRTLSLYNLSADAVELHIASEVEAERLRKEARQKKFLELSKAVAEKHGEEVLKLALRKKGSVLAILKVLSESLVQVELADMKKILRVSGGSAPVIQNLIGFVAGKVDVYKATKVALKAYAWAYLHNALPGVGFTGYFDDARLALEIYSKNWEIIPENKEATNLLGDFFPEV